MGFRKLRAKKYKGIQEYYKNSDPDKKTIAFYISYWANGTGKKERVETTDPNEALKILNERKAQQEQQKKEREEFELSGKLSNHTIDQTASEYFKERKKTGNIERDMKRYIKHIGSVVYETENIQGGRGYKLTNKTKKYTASIRGQGMVTKLYQRGDDDTSLSIGKMLIIDLTPDDIMRLIGALEKKGLSAKTISSIMNLLKAIVNHAVSEGYIIRNPFLHKKTRVEVPKEDRKRLFTPQERKEIFIQSRYDIVKLDKDGNQSISRGKPVILYQGDKRVFMLLKMLYFTGQRPQSIIKLRVRDINLKQRQISIDSIKDQSGTFVPISDKLYPLLKIWIKGCPPDQRLFDIEYVTFQNKTQKLFEKYNRGLDYKKHRYQWVSMYTFRHTAATVMLAKTNNIKTVQTVLNHSDPKVTAIYAKLLNDAKMEGVNVL